MNIDYREYIDKTAPWLAELGKWQEPYYWAVIELKDSVRRNEEAQLITPVISESLLMVLERQAELIGHYRDSLDKMDFKLKEALGIGRSQDEELKKYLNALVAIMGPSCRNYTSPQYGACAEVRPPPPYEPHECYRWCDSCIAYNALKRGEDAQEIS